MTRYFELTGTGLPHTHMRTTPSMPTQLKLMSFLRSFMSTPAASLICAASCEGVSATGAVGGTCGADVSCAALEGAVSTTGCVMGESVIAYALYVNRLGTLLRAKTTRA